MQHDELVETIAGKLLGIECDKCNGLGVWPERICPWDDYAPAHEDGMCSCCATCRKLCWSQAIELEQEPRE